MRIGSLNRRILIEKPADVDDPQGGTVRSWLPVAGDGKVWANIRFMNGSEAIKGESVLSTARASIRIRFREDVDPTCRVTYRDAVFEILSALPDGEKREFLDLAVQSGANDG